MGSQLNVVRFAAGRRQITQLDLSSADFLGNPCKGIGGCDDARLAVDRGKRRTAGREQGKGDRCRHAAVQGSACYGWACYGSANYGGANDAATIIAHENHYQVFENRFQITRVSAAGSTRLDPHGWVHTSGPTAINSDRDVSCVPVPPTSSRKGT